MEIKQRVSTRPVIPNFDAAEPLEANMKDMLFVFQFVIGLASV